MPVPLVYPPPQRRRLKSPRAEVEGEVDDGRESLFWLGGQHRAVAQRRVQCRHEVGSQVALCVGLRDRWVLRIAEVAVADGPVAGWADVGMRAAAIVLRHAVKALEPLGQIDGRLRNRDHDRTRSNTRPRNQKFSTPAHRAWSASSTRLKCLVQFLPVPTRYSWAKSLQVGLSAPSRSSAAIFCVCLRSGRS